LRTLYLHVADVTRPILLSINPRVRRSRQR
jgi:hypothetical protein